MRELLIPVIAVEFDVLGSAFCSWAVSLSLSFFFIVCQVHLVAVLLSTSCSPCDCLFAVLFSVVQSFVTLGFG
jgi:hypothetical protein